MNFIPPGEKYQEDEEEKEIKEYLQKEDEKARSIAKTQSRNRRGVSKLTPIITENVKEIQRDPTLDILKDVMKDIKVTLAKDTSPSVVDCFARLGCSIEQVQFLNKMKKLQPLHYAVE